jgi:hypothetical protein
MREFDARNLDLPEEQVADYCRRWQIREFALFGSALRDDFDRGSNLDVLVTFAPDAEWGLLDHVQTEQELATLLGRKVDPLNRRAVERSQNWIRRRAILDSAEVVYAAGSGWPPMCRTCCCGWSRACPTKGRPRSETRFNVGRFIIGNGAGSRLTNVRR